MMEVAIIDGEPMTRHTGHLGCGAMMAQSHPRCLVSAMAFHAAMCACAMLLDMHIM